MMSDDARPDADPDDAARAANRVHCAADPMGDRIRRRRGSGGEPPVFFGVVLLTVGGLFLLDNLDIIETRSVWRSFWPLLFLAWGTSRVISGDAKRLLPWLAIGGGAVLLANRMFGFPLDLARMFWPLLLIAFGALILYRAWRRPAVVHASRAAAGTAAFRTAETDTSADTSSTFKDSAMLGSVERRNVSQSFRGGEASAFLGSVEIDLRDSRMASTVAVIDVSVMIGSIELRIPRHWTVESRVSAMLGSFEDHTDTPIASSANRLVVRGSVFMGAVEIRN
jgi:predicted membrane protein